MKIIVDHTKCSGVRCPMQYTFVIDDCKLMRECPCFTPTIRMEHVTIQHVYLCESGDAIDSKMEELYNADNS